MCLHFSATGLDKKDFIGKSDPFLVILRQSDAGYEIVPWHAHCRVLWLAIHVYHLCIICSKTFSCSWVPVHKTEVVKKTLNPSWRPFSLKVLTLCNGDFDRYYSIRFILPLY